MATAEHAPVQQVVRKPMRRRLAAAGVLACLLLYLLWTVVPFVVMGVSSFKSLREAFELPAFGDWGGIVDFFRFDPTFSHYTNLFRNDNFGFYFRNSVLASLGAALVATSLGAMAAYSLSRARFRGKKDLYFWVITTRMAPVVAVMVPLYAIFKTLGLLSSIPGLIIAYTTFNLPFAIWILKGFFDAVPYDIEEAQMCDGASRRRAFLSILPLVAPGIAAVVVLGMLLAWNDFLFAAIIGGGDAKTLPVATASLKTSVGIRWGEIMAAGVITTLPMLALGLLIRKYLIQGLTMGAVRQ